MGFIDRVRGDETGTAHHYIELDIDQLAPPSGPDDRPTVHIAGIKEQRDVLEILDALHDGDVVIADIMTLTTSGPKIKHIIEELRQAAEEIGGDMAQKGDDQLIITPASVSINRGKLGRD